MLLSYLRYTNGPLLGITLPTFWWKTLMTILPHTRLLKNLKYLSVTPSFQTYYLRLFLSDLKHEPIWLYRLCDNGSHLLALSRHFNRGRLLWSEWTPQIKLPCVIFPHHWRCPLRPLPRRNLLPDRIPHAELLRDVMMIFSALWISSIQSSLPLTRHNFLMLF